MRRVELRTPEGRSTLRPVEGSGERWRADLAVRRPLLSRVLATASLVAVLVGLVTQLPELADLVLSLTAGLHGQDWRVPTFDLPAAVNAALTVTAVAAGVERALGLRHSAWLDD